MESIEASGKSVDEAVQQALMRLGKRRDEVEITVLQEPSRGAFGLGSKDARVRVSVRPGSVGAVITPEMADAILGPDDSYPGEEIYAEEDEDEFEEDEGDEDEEYEDEEEFEDEGDEDEYEDEDEVEVEEEPEAGLDLPGSADYAPELLAELENGSVAEGEMQDVETPSREDIDITVEVLQNILQYLNIRANIQVRSTNPLTLNIQGINENLGLLIGRRGETLAALQLLVSLIVGHRTKHRMRIIVDAENYRERREANLRSLALRVAQQVRNYRRSIALEAMPPHERRIVHIALSDSKDISTESIGEGDARRVVISLKRPGR
ncbi:MAG TPA: RNA-binding cell elongation regulator Jag/EloR [Ktedonobacteraceae bacterium]|nr:RNA-binding cell elongation regulator Jag/EloR [Ktedonobacteraceae bacterium]